MNVVSCLFLDEQLFIPVLVTQLLQFLFIKSKLRSNHTDVVGLVQPSCNCLL